MKIQVLFYYDVHAPCPVACNVIRTPDFQTNNMILIHELPDNISDTIRKLITDNATNMIPSARPFLVKLPIEMRDKERVLTLLTKEGVRYSKDPKEVRAMQIKQAVEEMLETEDMSYNASIYLSEKLQRNYAYLSTVFSEFFGFTIEHYIITYKMKKAKILLQAGNIKISEISRQLKYTSKAHFSSQFKKIEGMSPRAYKKQVKDSSSR